MDYPSLDEIVLSDDNEMRLTLHDPDVFDLDHPAIAALALAYNKAEGTNRQQGTHAAIVEADLPWDEMPEIISDDTTFAHVTAGGTTLITSYGVEHIETAPISGEFLQHLAKRLGL